MVQTSGSFFVNNPVYSLDTRLYGQSSTPFIPLFNIDLIFDLCFYFYKNVLNKSKKTHVLLQNYKNVDEYRF